MQGRGDLERLCERVIRHTLGVLRACQRVLADPSRALTELRVMQRHLNGAEKDVSRCLAQPPSQNPPTTP